jgi:hypothetical protein
MLLARTTGDKDQLVKEASEIWLHPNNSNRDTEFPLHHLWYAATNIITHENLKNISRMNQTEAT